MAFGKHPPNCACCTGPASWFVLLPSLAPTASIDSLVSATSQPEVVKSGSIRDWFRLPNWALPTRPVPLAPDDDDALIPLDAILAGRTKSPIRVEDLRAFVRNDSHFTVDSTRALEFLLTYNNYRASFFALPPEKRAPRAFAVLQGPSLADKAAEIQSSFPPSGHSLDELTPPPAARTGHTVQTNPHFDPECQPLRQEMQNIIDLYLQPHSLSPVTSLVSPKTLSQALSDARVTTHPSALDPVASNIHSHLTIVVLPRFLNHAVSNLSAATSRGRLLIACIAFAAAIVLEIFLIMYHAGRPARLLAMPLWVLAIGYGIGSQTGLCFWLAWRGAREHKSYEEGLGHLSSPSLEESSFKTSASSRKLEPRRPLTLLSRFSFSTRNPRERTPDRPDTMAEKGQLPQDINWGAADEKRVSGKSWRSLSEDSSIGSRDSFVPLVDHKDGLAKKIMQLTGTAVDTIAVEDSRIRKLQAMVGVRVAVWLVLSTSLVVGIVMAVP